ncbi:hypothetical protein Leryth_022995 [Lithospermum erythrorhizon]|nr:hypothetical protein Leryth_022995 [Lithospermum erythrorhizon]
MGERKVLNKYYPPDFDPVKLPRSDDSSDGYPMWLFEITSTKGTKFNSRKEDVVGEHLVVRSIKLDITPCFSGIVERLQLI